MRGTASAMTSFPVVKRVPASMMNDGCQVPVTRFPEIETGLEDEKTRPEKNSDSPSGTAVWRTTF